MTELHTATKNQLADALIQIGREETEAQLELIRACTRSLYAAMKAGDNIELVDVGCGQDQPWSITKQRFVGIAVTREPRKTAPGQQTPAD